MRPLDMERQRQSASFLNQYAGTADLVWVSLAGSGGSVEYLWNHLVENIQGSDLRHTLKKMGYPYDELKRANLVDLLIDYEYKRPAVLVLDDFQVINDPGSVCADQARSAGAYQEYAYCADHT